MNTADQYLKTIYVLQQASDSPASTGDIADRLGVSPASANEMIGKLVERGLVNHKKYNAVVTEEGEQRARTAVETYCVIQRFLYTVLEVKEYRSEARSIEGVLDPMVAERLDTLIDRHAECPDCFDGVTDQCEYLELAETVDSAEEIPSPIE
jgi:DtxR family Mn-dependent transcriptional regulator